MSAAGEGVEQQWEGTPPVTYGAHRENWRVEAERLLGELRTARVNAQRTLESDREFLQQVADSYGIRTDEVTVAFLAKQASIRAASIESGSDKLNDIADRFERGERLTGFGWAAEIRQAAAEVDTALVAEIERLTAQLQAARTIIVRALEACDEPWPYSKETVLYVHNIRAVLRRGVQS